VRREADAPVGEPHARSARWVAAGILFSRISGLAREMAFAGFFGTSLYADAFRAALRMPNVLQNLLGEGTLSASFIPVYSRLLGQGREEEAGRVAGVVFAFLVAVAGALALIGILLAPVLVDIFLVGFEGERRDVTVALVRIMFPMTGFFVLAAWALGILNSHRRFFIPYVAPVLWNGAMIATLLLLGRRLDVESLVMALGWGALIGGILQFAIQLPWVFRLERHLSVRWDPGLEGVKQAARNAGPAILGRGVVQLSGWADLILASLLAQGAVAALGYAQTLYMLPVSLFGMSVAAAELPELARRGGERAEELRHRVNAGLRQIAFFVVPAVAGYLVLGDVVVAALYQRGTFERADTLLVYLVLLGYTIGLLASTGTRLFSSASFALHDTKTPAKYALARVTLAAAAGYLLMFRFDTLSVDGRFLGPLGLSLAAGLAAWVEWVLLRRHLRRLIGHVTIPGGVLIRMLFAAAVAAALGRVLDAFLPAMDPIVEAAIVLPVFGILYLALALLLGLPEAGRLLRRFGRLGRPG